MYRTRVRWTVADFSAGVRRNPSRAQRKADSVLPEPVGATTSACWPEEMASHAPSCAVVGAAKAPANHSRVAGVNRARTSSAAGCLSGPGAAPGWGCRAIAAMLRRGPDEVAALVGR